VVEDLTGIDVKSAGGGMVLSLTRLVEPVEPAN
jgi:hypothetical protein